MDSDRRLYRPASGRMIGGVAAGLADHFGIDIALSRIIWGVMFFAGIGIPLYVLCWIVIPRAPIVTVDGMFEETSRSSRSTLLTLVKIGLLFGAGAIIASEISSDVALVAFLVGLAFGLYYLWRNRAVDEEEARTPTSSRLYRSETNRRILGVFGGLGDALGVDPTVLRIVGGIILVAGMPIIVPLYLLYAIVVPARRVISI